MVWREEIVPRKQEPFIVPQKSIVDSSGKKPKKERGGENNTRTIESQKSIIETLRREIKHSTIRLRSIQTIIRNLETSKHGMELEIEKLNKALAQGKISKEMADSSLALIQAKINSIDKKILDKKGKLEEAQKKLYDAQEKLSEYQDCIAEKQQGLANLDEKRAAAEERLRQWNREQ